MNTHSSILAILIASTVSAQVRFAESNGAHMPRPIADPPVPINDFAAGDFDNDGDLDFVAATDSGFEMVFWNDGHGAFYRTVLPTNGLNAKRHALVGDVDGNGTLDVVFLPGATARPQTAPTRAEMVLGDGAGGFVAAAPSMHPLTRFVATDGALADIDGDTDLDVIAFRAFDAGSPNSPRVSVWQNDGAGVFVDITFTAIPSQIPTHAVRGHARDVDGDGDIDLVVSGVGELLRNDGTGRFIRNLLWNGPNTILDLGDVDGDGVLDFLAPNGVFVNNGHGTPTTPAAIHGLDLFGAKNASLVDFDGDGLLDVIGTDSRAIPVLWRRVGAAFVDVSDAWLAEGTRRDRSIELVYGTHLAMDLDGDGDVDMLTGGTEARSASSTTVAVPPKILMNTGTRLVEVSRRQFAWSQVAVTTVATGDVDGDGDLDLFVHEHPFLGSSRVERIWIQDDTGTIDYAQELVAQPAPCAAAEFVDIDGDSDQDLVTVRGWDPYTLFAGSRAHRVHRNDGNGVFTDVTATALPAGTSGAGAALAVGDVDGDGDSDLVIGEQDDVFFSTTGAQNRLLLNDGTGTFTDATAQLPARLDRTIGLRLSDLDGDGDLDLISANGGDPSMPAAVVFVMQNDGGGTFTNLPAAAPDIASSGEYLDVVDLDGDGDFDLTIRGWDLHNDGGARFTASSVPSDRVLTRDFDGNGLMDNVGAGPDRYGIDFQPESIEWGHAAASPRAITADLDRDLDLDLVLFGAAPMLAGESSELRLGVVWNLRRDLEVRARPRAGRSFRIDVRADRRSLVVPLLGFTAHRPGLRIDPFGWFQLDPTAHFALPSLVVPNADTAITFELPLPTTLGIGELHVQALFVPTGGVGLATLSELVSAPVLL